MKQTSEVLPVPLLPPKASAKKIGRSVYLSEDRWARLEEISEETKGEDPGGTGYSRNEVIENFIDWGISQYEKERVGKRPVRK